MKRETVDVLIVGGGVMGLFLAFHLRRLGVGGSVAVVERDPRHGQASTARATGGVRQLFGSEANVRLARTSLAFYERFAEEVAAVAGRAPEPIGFRPSGYLFLADERSWPVWLARRPLWERLGVEAAWLSPAEAGELLPGLCVSDLAGAVLGLRDGVYEPPAILRALARAVLGGDGFPGLGVALVSGEAARLLLRRGPAGRPVACEGVELASGDRVLAGATALAAGAWSGRVLGASGLPVWVYPRRRLVYLARPAGPWPAWDERRLPHGLPMVVDPTGLHFRERYGLVQLVEARPDDPDAFDFTFDDRPFPEMARRAAQRWPRLKGLRLVEGWAGLYEMCAFDGNGLVGPHPEVENLFLLTGFSGHGVMQAPAAALAVAEMIAYGTAKTMDVPELRPERIPAGRPLREEAVL